MIYTITPVSDEVKNMLFFFVKTQPVSAFFHCDSAITKTCKIWEAGQYTPIPITAKCLPRLQEIPKTGSSPFLFISENNNNKAPAEPHLDVREQGLYGGQAFRKDEGSVVETCWELLSCRVRHPLTALPAWWGFLEDLSITALPGCVSGQGAVFWRAERHFDV